MNGRFTRWHKKSSSPAQGLAALPVCRSVSRPPSMTVPGSNPPRVAAIRGLFIAPAIFKDYAMKSGRLFGTICLSSLIVALAQAPAAADTTVSADSSTPLKTSSAGDITIATDAALAVASGAANTVDSNKAVPTEEPDTQ